jgi:hypothetical protein
VAELSQPDLPLFLIGCPNPFSGGQPELHTVLIQQGARIGFLF